MLFCVTALHPNVVGTAGAGTADVVTDTALVQPLFPTAFFALIYARYCVLADNPVRVYAVTAPTDAVAAVSAVGAALLVEI